MFCEPTADQTQTVRREKNGPDRKSIAALAQVLTEEKRRRGAEAWDPVAKGTAHSSNSFRGHHWRTAKTNSGCL